MPSFLDFANIYLKLRNKNKSNEYQVKTNKY